MQQRVMLSVLKMLIRWLSMLLIELERVLTERVKMAIKSAVFYSISFMRNNKSSKKCT